MYIVQALSHSRETLIKIHLEQCSAVDQKQITLQNEVNYQIAFENADQYSRFQFDGSEFTHDITFGLSNFAEGSGVMFEAVIGGWIGAGSVIRNRTNLSDNDAYTDLISRVSHSREEFDNFKNDIEVIATDGQIIVKTNGNVLMQYQDDSIKPNELKYLLVTGGWNGMGTLKITGFPDGRNEKQVTLPNEVNYRIAFENADQYSRFQFDGSEFTHDITFGLSNFAEGSGVMFEAVIGGWIGAGSVIRNRTNLSDNDAYTDLISRVSHSREEFDSFKNDIELIATDGQIIVKANGNVLMQYQDNSIKHNELKYLLVTGGWNGQGTLKITGYPDEGNFFNIRVTNTRFYSVKHCISTTILPTTTTESVTQTTTPG